MPNLRSAEDNKNKGGRPRTLTQAAKTTLYLPNDLRQRIDSARNGVSLAEWIRQAIEERLARQA